MLLTGYKQGQHKAAAKSIEAPLRAATKVGCGRTRTNVAYRKKILTHEDGLSASNLQALTSVEEDEKKQTLKQ